MKDFQQPNRIFCKKLVVRQCQPSAIKLETVQLARLAAEAG